MWMALHADAPMGEGGWACVRICSTQMGEGWRGWVCVRMGGCACGWVGVHADEWVCVRIGGLRVDK